MTVRSKMATLSLIPLATVGSMALTGALPAGASAKTITVKAIETEYRIALSVKSFKPGDYTFVTENKGTIVHALEITGPGLHDPATRNISPGKKADLKVTLENGRYDIFCPIPGHKALGMNVNIVVVGPALHTTSSKGHKSPATSGGAVSY
jgi:uncharacterized cupredoxin-like copper-binding protein